MGIINDKTSKDKQEYFSIDFLHIFKFVWHRIWAIILAGLIAGTAGFAYSRFIITPKYSSSVKLYVNNNSSISGGKFTFNASELTAAQELVDTYVVMLKSRTTLEELFSKAGIPEGKYNHEERYNMIEADSVNDTEVLKVTVTSTSAEEAYNIAHSIQEYFPGILARIITSDIEMTVVENSYLETQKVSPYITKYVAVTAIIGALVAFIVLVVLALLDDTIHDEDYLLKNYEYPILAKVPNLLGNTGKQYNYYYQKKKAAANNTNKE